MFRNVLYLEIKHPKQCCSKEILQCYNGTMDIKLRPPYLDLCTHTHTLVHIPTSDCTTTK